MKVLITGSSGALGTLITKNLIANKVSVAGIDIAEPEEKLKNRIRFYSCSISDRQMIELVFREENPTNVIHFACTFNRVRDPVAEHEIDIGGSRNILDMCNATHSVRQLIFSSSAAAYGGNRENPEWLSESHPLNPGRYRYGINKKLIEEMFSTTVRKDLNVNLVRICTVIGPDYVKPASVVSILSNWSWLPEFCRENKLQFLHTRDFVSIMNRIIFDTRIRGTFNIAPDTFSVVKELFPDKKYFKLPVSVIRGFLSVCWHLRLMNLSPAGVNNSIYPILMNPAKIKARYGYKFRYTSSEAFKDACRGMSANMIQKRPVRAAVKRNLQPAGA
jgi:UDP-glucose 4-epimerase